MLDECFFLEIYENDERIPAGDANGYGTFDEAKKAALRLIDDALPQNVVRVLKRLAVAHLGGNGEARIRE